MRSRSSLRRDLEQADPHFVDYVLKPATDEMWNLIDGIRTIGEIVDYALLEFDLRTDPDLWLRVFAGWRSGRADCRRFRLTTTYTLDDDAACVP